ncbi:hypothetical protein NIES2104_64300 [Leptolyngbya sp. NIES-2104]|nr:hypothetical protein NIES2104_64300 [Leptolyngbya sp. NIES-2104]
MRKFAQLEFSIELRFLSKLRRLYAASKRSLIQNEIVLVNFAQGVNRHK